MRISRFVISSLQRENVKKVSFSVDEAAFAPPSFWGKKVNYFWRVLGRCGVSPQRG
jgi:hypothetical protein